MRQAQENSGAAKLRIALITRRMTSADLAAMMGKSPRRVHNVLCNNDRTWPIRAAINRALRSKIFAKPRRPRRIATRKTPRTKGVVGSNPNAVAKSIAEFAHAYRAGILADSDLDLLAGEFAKGEAGSAAGRPAALATARQRSRSRFLDAVELALKSPSRDYSFPSDMPGRRCPFPEVKQTEQTQTEQTDRPIMKTSNFIQNFDQLTGATKTAFERAEMARRGGDHSEVARAVRLALQAERRERRHSCGDPVERVLADPEQRLLLNAIGRLITGARLNPDEDRVLGELKEVAKDFTPGISTASGPGQMLFPIAINPDVWSALLTYGAFRDLGVRTISGAYERFAVVTALPSAIFLNPSNQGSVTIPADTSFAGLSMFAPSNTVATRLVASYDVIQDMKADVANAVLSYLLIGLAARLDFAAFSGNGANDYNSAGQFGIFYTAGIGSFVPAKGVTNISSLSRSDFINTIGARSRRATARRELPLVYKPGVPPHAHAVDRWPGPELFVEDAGRNPGRMAPDRVPRYVGGAGALCQRGQCAGRCLWREPILPGRIARSL